MSFSSVLKNIYSFEKLRYTHVKLFVLRTDLADALFETENQKV